MNIFELRTKIERRREDLTKMMVTPGHKTLEDYQRALTTVRTLDEVLEMMRERANDEGNAKPRSAA